MTLKENIKIPIYNASIIVIIADDFASLMEDRDCDVSEGFLAATKTTSLPFNYVVGFEREALCHMIVSHEACHVTHRIMNDAGIDHELTGDEAEAYLHGYVINEMYKIIKKNKLMCYGD